MNATLAAAFFDAAGIHASSLNNLIRLFAGLVIVVIAVWLVAGFLKLLDKGDPEQHVHFVLCLVGLAVILMVYFTFVVG